eukprot:scaffold8593_cov248-Pinguiococcus_pyrenoidosus.AAC.6
MNDPFLNADLHGADRADAIGVLQPHMGFPELVDTDRGAQVVRHFVRSFVRQARTCIRGPRVLRKAEEETAIRLPSHDRVCGAEDGLFGVFEAVQSFDAIALRRTSLLSRLPSPDAAFCIFLGHHQRIAVERSGPGGRDLQGAAVGVDQHGIARVDLSEGFEAVEPVRSKQILRDAL